MEFLNKKIEIIKRNIYSTALARSLSGFVGNSAFISDLYHYSRGLRWSEGFDGYFDPNSQHARNKVVRSLASQISGKGLCFPYSAAAVETSLNGGRFEDNFRKFLLFILNNKPMDIWNLNQELSEDEKLPFKSPEDSFFFNPGEGWFDKALFDEYPGKTINFFNKLLEKDGIRVRLSVASLNDFDEEGKNKSLYDAGLIIIDKLDEFFKQGKAVMISVFLIDGANCSRHSVALIGTKKKGRISKGLVMIDQNYKSPIVLNPLKVGQFFQGYIMPYRNMPNYYRQYISSPWMVIEKQK